MGRTKSQGNKKPKPGKKMSEMNHENQERAYIAASRRHDRVLQARIESAKKASHLHQQRTGKALLVTQEAVINEEMYLEIDPSEHKWREEMEALTQKEAYLNSQLGLVPGFMGAQRKEQMSPQTRSTPSFFNNAYNPTTPMYGTNHVFPGFTPSPFAQNSHEYPTATNQPPSWQDMAVEPTNMYQTCLMNDRRVHYQTMNNGLPRRTSESDLRRSHNTRYPRGPMQRGQFHPTPLSRTQTEPPLGYYPQQMLPGQHDSSAYNTSPTYTAPTYPTHRYMLSPNIYSQPMAAASESSINSTASHFLTSSTSTDSLALSPTQVNDHPTFRQILPADPCMSWTYIDESSESEAAGLGPHTPTSPFSDHGDQWNEEFDKFVDVDCSYQINPAGG